MEARFLGEKASVDVFRVRKRQQQSSSFSGKENPTALLLFSLNAVDGC
jgi:hypothetical protein